MSKAEIHGKISSYGSNLSDRLEDLLTSDIFGTLRYLPFQEGLLNIILQSKNYNNGAKISIDNCVIETQPKISFWPKLSRSEPDVIIETDDELFMVEVKYLSGKSGHFERQNFEQDTIEAASSDQLGREFMDLLDFPGKFSRRFLIYLTSHRRMPISDIKAGYDAILTTSPSRVANLYQNDTYWLSWFSVYESISLLIAEQKNNYQKLILNDLKDLLHKKGFRVFEGFLNRHIKDVNEQNGILFYEKSIRTYCQKYSQVDEVKNTVFYQTHT